MSTSTPAFDFSTQTQSVSFAGEWTLLHEAELAGLYRKLIHALARNSPTTLTLDGRDLVKLDSVGALWLEKVFSYLKNHHISYTVKCFPAAQSKFIQFFIDNFAQCHTVPSLPHLPWIARLGKNTLDGLQQLYAFLSFVGEITRTFLFLLLHPKRIPWRILFNIIQTAGYNALPITGLLSFLIGIVLAYQMGQQLRNYGANIFVVDLMALSVLREFAPMMTAIIIAGRSGSAFTAQLGTMKVNQEIDALSTLGIKPVERLVMPKVLGLLIALPLVTVWADLLGILGGMVMAKSILNIHFSYFIQRFDEVVPLRWYLIGLIKTPVFALLIASIGCFQGLQVEYNADSVGTHTTRSVVQAIFMIITFDAFFSILLSWLKI